MGRKRPSLALFALSQLANLAAAADLDTGMPFSLGSRSAAFLPPGLCSNPEVSSEGFTTANGELFSETAVTAKFSLKCDGKAVTGAALTSVVEGEAPLPSPLPSVHCTPCAVPPAPSQCASRLAHSELENK